MAEKEKKWEWLSRQKVSRLIADYENGMSMIDLIVKYRRSEHAIRRHINIAKQRKELENDHQTANQE